MLEAKTDLTVKMIYGDEPKLLQKVCKGKTVLEIGAYEGYSTLIIAEVAKHITSIDTFEADCIMDVMNKNTLKTYKKNTESYDNISYIVGNSREVVFNEPYDILFVDGDHSFEGCYSDLKRFKPKEGYLVHDWRMPKVFPGVMAACMKFFRRYPDLTVGCLAYWKV